MVFKMITSGKHVKKINGRFLKDQEFNLDVNPNGQNKVFLKTQELDNGRHKIYKNAFNSIDDFMRDYNNNNNSLFELNKNIYRPRYVTPKYKRFRYGIKVPLKHDGTKKKKFFQAKKKFVQAKKKFVQAKKKSVQAKKKFVQARKKSIQAKKKSIKNKIDELKKKMQRL